MMANGKQLLGNGEPKMANRLFQELVNIESQSEVSSGQEKSSTKWLTFLKFLFRTLRMCNSIKSLWV